MNNQFLTYTRELFGEEVFERFLKAFDVPAPVSVRVNPFKLKGGVEELDIIAKANGTVERVLWCENAYYLPERPNFTMDPLLHAGVYYVQEASSMFLDKVLRTYVKEPVRMLDLCAAPGGKSTLARAALPAGSTLMSNEPDRRRANILNENILKQGHPDVTVTNCYAKDYRKAKLTFDVVLADVPCSGEGMFRKDAGAIDEWSLANVMKCAALQMSIIEDIWPCIEEGGILIYSTCTYNLHEDEENVRWICESLGAELLPVEVDPAWGIHGSLMPGWSEPVYRFIPGSVRGEGLFMAVMRKTSDDVLSGKQNLGALRIVELEKEKQNAPKEKQNPAKAKKQQPKPEHSEALSIELDAKKHPQVELTLDDALKYLHHEAIVLPEGSPIGYVVVTYKGYALGFVKNIGNRANNLYPQEWKIRNLGSIPVHPTDA